MDTYPQLTSMSQPGSLHGYIEIYDERIRLPEVLSKFSWLTRLYVFEKAGSTSCKSLCCADWITYISVPYANVSTNFLHNLSFLTSEWIFFITASSSIDSSLGSYVSTLLMNEPLAGVGAIELPYKMTALGITSRHSPWNTTYKRAIYRRKFLTPSSVPHEELSTFRGSIYRLDTNSYGYLYHITHITVSSMLERHIRYAKEEVRLASAASVFRPSLCPVLKAIVRLIFVNKVLLLRSDGLYLLLAYLTYPVLIYLFAHESFRKAWQNVIPDKF